MTEFFNQKIQAFISIASLMTSWFIAQASIIEQGFDQLFSLGLLIVAVIVIWKAFSKKDQSETDLMKEQVDVLQKMNETLQETVNHQREIIEDLRK